LFEANKNGSSLSDPAGLAAAGAGAFPRVT
jgi:hypothetical protein